MFEPYARVKNLIAGRRAGTVSLRQFKAQIEPFSNRELACLAVALLETSPSERKQLQRALLKYGDTRQGPSA
jgi:hypothetical protein